MKEDLEKILKKKDWYKPIKLKDLKNSCCPESELEVLDGDFIKDQLSEYLQIDPPSSCDAIYLNEKKIFLLEMKSIQELKNSYEVNQKGFSSFDDYFRDWLAKKLDRKLEDKIIDTGFMLLSLAGLFNASKDFFKQFLDKTKSSLEINFIFITDLSSE